MFIQAGAFDGMVVNLQENDIANATLSYNVFAYEYKKISRKVPEWRGYFDIAAVNRLGVDLNSSDVPNAVVEIGNVGLTCEKCMGERRAQVWAKYYWRDFDTVNVSTSNGNMLWVNAMDALAGSFEGIAANAEKGNQSQTNDSFNQFEGLYKDVKEACNNCHNTPRLYYVSDDVFAQINQMGANISANNLSAAIANQQGLGIQCYRCHVLHMPAEDMKSMMTISADKTNTRHDGFDMKRRNDETNTKHEEQK
jgi:nitrate/TMAO reductase-like tetraheme cytochrome c subunit